MDDSRKVNCGKHGQVGPAFICTHLAEEGWTRYVGFNQAPVDPHNRQWGDLNAWCTECERVLARCGEWDDESEAFAKITLTCEVCFAKIASVQNKLRQEQS